MRVLSLTMLATATSACSGNLQCSLNGLCTQGSCVCDLPWTGESCETLRVLPVNRSCNPGAGIYGYDPNVSSWGGSILKGDDDLYHLFVAQMKTGGLIGWGTQSECVHATSQSPTGPFLKSEVALANECHGPVVIRDKAGEFLMFHIGDGGNSNANTSSFMHHSAKPTGPWVPAKTNPGSCGMPTAAYHPNGTLFMVCGNGKTLMSADRWDGQWSKIVDLQHPGGWEDPTLWFDNRQNWHIIFHAYALEPFSSGIEKYSGHGFSEDGLAWTFSDPAHAPFGGTVEFTDGSAQSFATRERPQLVFADADHLRATPVGMTSAVSSQPLGPWCDNCRSGACSQCKVTPGRDWTYTIFQPLARSE